MVKDLDQLERLSIAQHSRYHSSPLCEKEILNTPIEEKDLLNKHECSKPVCYRSNRMTLESIIRNNMKNLNKKLSIYCLTIDQSAWKKIHKKNQKKIWYRRDQNGGCRFYYDIDSTKNYQPLKLGSTVTDPEVILLLYALCSRFKTF